MWLLQALLGDPRPGDVLDYMEPLALDSMDEWQLWAPWQNLGFQSQGERHSSSDSSILFVPLGILSLALEVHVQRGEGFAVLGSCTITQKVFMST